MNATALQLIGNIAQNALTGARFASLTYTAKGSGEKARHTVALGVSLEKAYKRDIAILRGKRPQLTGVMAQACDELIASLEKSLAVGIGNNPAYTCADVYSPVCAGVKVHKESGEVHVYGFSVAKKVLAPGVFKAVNSSEKTKAKDALRRTLKSGKFRQFNLTELASARVNGKTLEME